MGLATGGGGTGDLTPLRRPDWAATTAVDAIMNTNSSTNLRVEKGLIVRGILALLAISEGQDFKVQVVG